MSTINPKVSPTPSIGTTASTPAINTVTKFVDRRKGEKCVFCLDASGSSCILDDDIASEYQLMGQDILDSLDPDLKAKRKYAMVRYKLYRRFASDFLGSESEPLPTCVEIKLKLLWRCPHDDYVGYKHTSIRNKR